jgi:transposase InsO family protein
MPRTGAGGHAFADEDWLYLAAVKDMATREIVGSRMADHLRSSLCENALMMAIQHRASPWGLIHHSDRGCHCWVKGRKLVNAFQWVWPCF